MMSQAVTYLAASAKSNAAYMAINAAIEAVKTNGDLPVPLHLRNAPTKLMKEIGYGADYKYSHNYTNNFSKQEYLPDDLAGSKFYDPGNNARENEMKEYLKKLWGDKYNY
jgi:putative ATPase